MGIFNREINEPRENFKTLNTLADAGRGAVGAGWDLTTKARRHEGKQMGDGRWGFLTAKYTNHAKILKH